MSEIGHNKPPEMTITVGEVAKDLSDWMAQNPIIEQHEKALEAKVYVDRAKLAIKDLESERDSKVRPLNEQVKAINEEYRAPRELLRRVLDELEFRVTDFLAKEEAKRIKEAEEARQAAERAEQVARDAERTERERLLAASGDGELDVDVSAVIGEADRAFAAYQAAQRKAKVAERDAENVRLGGGFTRALSLRDVETIHVTDLLAAVTAMKDSGRIVEAVIKSARSYKKVFGKYPPGIEISVERKA